MRRVIVTLAGLIYMTAMSAQTADASSVIEESREKTMADAMSAVVTLTINDRNGNKRVRTNSMVSKKFPDGTEKRYLRFLSPAEVQGTTILIHDYRDRQDDMWIYLPALKRVRRVVSSEKGKSFMGSEFTNADISSPPASDFINRHTAESGRSGEWIIESVPATPALESDYGYARRISYFDMKNLQLRKMLFYDRSGVHARTIEVISTRPLGKDGSYIISEMSSVNHITGRSSKLMMENISTVVQTGDNLFDPVNIDK